MPDDARTVPVTPDFDPDTAAALADPATRACVERLIRRTVRPTGVERLFAVMDAISVEAERPVAHLRRSQNFTSYNSCRTRLRVHVNPEKRGRRKMDLLVNLDTLLRVAKCASFSRAARELGIPQPLASRRVAFLEHHYGVQLLHRTTRSLGLTEEGRALLSRVMPALEEIETAGDAVRTLGASVVGVVRLGASVALAEFIGARIGVLLHRHPELRVSLSVAEPRSCMIAEGLDLLVTADPLSEESLVGRRIGRSRCILVAAPDYLERAGWPDSLEQLAMHDCVLHATSGSAAWLFDGPHGPRAVTLCGRLLTTSDEVARRATLDGLGIGLLPDSYVAGAIETGQLHHILKDYATVECPIRVLYPSQRYMPARVRTVIDFLVQDFAWRPAGPRRHPAMPGSGSIVPLRQRRHMDNAWTEAAGAVPHPAVAQQ